MAFIEALSQLEAVSGADSKASVSQLLEAGEVVQQRRGELLPFVIYLEHLPLSVREESSQSLRALPIGKTTAQIFSLAALFSFTAFSPLRPSSLPNPARSPAPGLSLKLGKELPIGLWLERLDLLLSLDDHR